MGLGYRQNIQVEENRLELALSKIYKRIQFDLESGLSIGEMHTLYQKPIHDTIRASVTSVYVLSAKKSVEQDIRVPFFLTELDLQEIRRLSQKYEDSFLMSVSREANMRTSEGVKTKPLPPMYDPNSLLLIKRDEQQPTDTRFRQGFIGRIAQSIHGEVSASAVVSKGRQLVLPTVRRNRRDTRRRGTSLFRRAASAAATEENGIEPHLIWRTADDEATCPECQALEGTTYSLEDIGSVPIPSETTHPRCRCELELEDADTALEVSDELEASSLFF